MPAAPEIFETNLRALSRIDPALAERVRAAHPAALEWGSSKTGQPTASIVHEGRPLLLASRYDPVAEARKLVAEIDYQKAACVVLLGMGLGYHIPEVLSGIGDLGLIVVHEPDLGLLRAVLERIDHSAWLGQPRVVLTDAAFDRAMLTERIERHAGLVTQGTQLVMHPPTRQRFPDQLAAFSKMVADTLAYCRTNVATALVNSARTCFNSASNIAHYVAGSGTDDLVNAAQGMPAICVGAGPSLVRNVDLLRDPAVRRNVVLITAQTTLRPLLDRGIRPDFVTALDWSAISQRFYEGLPDLPDVTLVAEPKAHPTILDSFPGPIRCAKSGFCDELLGELAQPRVAIRSGATVAHLSFYLAQHLGCDPIIMIGQDLGFSDGLYYVPGTAIHDVWAGELNAFNTIEMLEWQRIVRNKSHLQRFEDVRGQPIFSDEQMLTYLKQFERDFAAAPQLVIDATEGGMPKADTTRMPLAEALERYATRPVPELPKAPRSLDAGRLDAVAELLTRRVHEVTQLGDATRESRRIVESMLEHQRDRTRMQKLFAQLEKQRARVDGDLRQAFTLVNALNMIGMYKRFKTDRTIGLSAISDPFERQRRQLERDLENLHWLEQACGETLSIFQEARRRVHEARERGRQPRREAA